MVNRMQSDDEQYAREHKINENMPDDVLDDIRDDDAKRYKRELTREKKTFWTSIVILWGLTSFLTLVIGFCKINPLDLVGNRELARLMASIVFPMSAILTFVFTQSLNLHKELSASKFTRPIQLTACARMSQISTATVVLCAITGMISVYYLKSAVDILLSISLYLLPLIFALLIFNVLYFYYTYYER
jgi:hypothetical protein